jgi:hypothetical protein
MSGDLSADEIREKIEAGSSAWRDIIPSEEHDRFVGRVQQAVTIYLSLVSPKDLRDELEGFEKATRSPTAPIGQLISGLSADAHDILAGSEPLPSPPPDGAAEQGYYNDIRSRLIRAQRWNPEGKKRRRQTDIVGPPKKMGRPSDARIEVLVSFICAAYAYAVGKPTSRSWFEKGESDIEIIVGDCFANLDIDDVYSAQKAVQRHIGNRNLLD